MPPFLYDLFWVYPPPPGRLVIPAQSARNGARRNVANRDGVPGVILYPALCTPEIVWGNEKVELLMAFRREKTLLKRAEGFFGFFKRKVVDEAKLKACVNRQLKVCQGLNPQKPYTGATLVDDVRHIEIQFVSEGLDTNQIYKTQSRFHGLLHKTAAEFYQSHGFTLVYWISIPTAALRGRAPRPPRPNAPPVPAPHQYTKPGTVLKEVDQDRLISESVKDTNAPQMEFGQYGYEVGADDVIVGNLDHGNPVQSFHPVFYYPRLAAVNIGHISDVHINSRQQALAKSPSRLPNHRANADNPAIGDYVNIASRNTKALLGKFRDDPDIDALVLTGDIIDYVENVWDPRMGTNDPMSAQEILDLVDMGAKGDAYRERYKDNVDFLVFYSLVTDYYRSSGGKPIYAVTGNHDCYKGAQGIYPMLVHRMKGTDMTVPANHNLTIYEACAVFGESHHRFGSHGKVTGMAGSGFDPKYLGWIHKVLTPFSDFAVQTPTQALTGLGWGNSEVVGVDLRRPRDILHAGNQGVGFLPLADQSVSDRQLEMIRTVGQTGRNLVLFSHFTFVSYKNAIPESKILNARQPVRPDVRVDVKGRQTYFDEGEMGTFQLHRKELYVDLLKAGRIACILTGHSHRRAVYELGEPKETKGVYGIPTEYYRPGTGEQDPLEFTPDSCPVVVCDASGSLTRRNRADEFLKFGNGQCSGITVRFTREGRVDRVYSVPVGRKPRFAVAMSYYSHKVEPLIGVLETKPFKKKDHAQGLAAYQFRLWSRWLNRWGRLVRIETMHLYWLNRGAWADLLMLPANLDDDDRRLEPPPQAKFVPAPLPNGPSAKKLLENAAVSRDTLFLSIKFACKEPPDAEPLTHRTPEQVFDGYDFASPWTFPAKLKFDVPGDYLADAIIDKLFGSSATCVIEPLSHQWPQDFNWTYELVNPRE